MKVKKRRSIIDDPIHLVRCNHPLQVVVSALVMVAAINVVIVGGVVKGVVNGVVSGVVIGDGLMICGVLRLG